MNEPVQQIVHAIADAMSPEQVILFGSHARGDATPESDIDLVVVCSDDRQPREMQRDIHRLFKRPAFSLDVFVYRASDFATQRRIANTIAREASEHGIACHG